jgi:hypothetical protein
VTYRTALRPWLGVLLTLQAVSSAAAGTWSATPAGDLELASAQRLTALEAEVAAMQDARLCSAGADCSPSPVACGGCQTGGLYTGAAFVLAKPHFKEAFQATVLDASGVFNLVPFSYDYDVTPRVWLGYAGGSGLGVRARYWQYDQDAPPFHSSGLTAAQAHVVTVIFPGIISATPPGEFLSVVDSLEVHTTDLEGTQRVNLGCVSLVVGGGLRYALMQQQTRAAVTDDGAVEQALNWQRRFEGIGPLASVEISRPLGCRGLAVVGAFRGALLFGDKNLDRLELNGLGGGPPLVSLDGASEVLGIGEVELGFEWTRQLANGGSLQVRGTYEGQLWSDSGTPTLGYLGFQGFGLGFGLAR